MMTVSFVLMSPSTVMRLKLGATASVRAAFNTVESIFASVVMKAEHRRVHPPFGRAGGPGPGWRHAGLDHAGAFAYPADPNRLLRNEFEFHRDLFRPRVARHDRLSRVVRTCPVRRSAARRRRECPFSRSPSAAVANPPRGGDQHVSACRTDKPWRSSPSLATHPASLAHPCRHWRCRS